ncbi:MAG: glycoside hydrolase family 2 protein [Solirubrobacterales bacterium]|nr:glycoside hydrolase family 2 protein [Solirubrobacterales bacterium]
MRLPERPPGPAPARVRVQGDEEIAIAGGWQAARCAPDSHDDPSALGELDWIAARVPGTAAGALRDAGRWRPGAASDLDADDWWFRTSFDAPAAAAGESVALALDGIATVSDVFVNGVELLRSDSMFAAHEVDVGALLAGSNELAIRCRALAPLLAVRRKPRARWRTRLVDGNLRFFRTMLLGRAPGFAPDPATVGPWRGVRVVRRRAVTVRELTLDPRLDGVDAGADGLLGAQIALEPVDDRTIEAVELRLEGPSGAFGATLEMSNDDGVTRASGTLRIASVARWWPHTHGDAALHDVSLKLSTSAGPVTVDAGRTGFRALAPGRSAAHDVQSDGLDLHVNGIRVFARGAVWTPVDPVSLAPEPQALRARLQLVRDAGMNMLRIPGTSAYESETFHDLCDELGLLVWQDFMFANLDYPIADEQFRRTVEREARAVLAEAAGRPSLAVICGNSEIEQQVAMLGLDPELGRGELFGVLLPRLIEQSAVDAVYVPSAPCGGVLPFRPDRGIANYYGVGGYRRPVEDARRAQVRFAAECLAFSNVPDEAGVEQVLPCAPGEVVVHHPAWKAGVPRDVGTGWDFEDVRDHYLASVFQIDASELRRVDHDRYLELSRAVTGELMAEVFGEWRRGASPCGGGLVLWLNDLAPGAGWGVVDSGGRPKPAYHHLRRALAPTSVWMTDEGLGGVRVHVANDGPAPLHARLRVALYRDGEQRVAEAHEHLDLRAHSSCEHDLEALIGHFIDASWAYRFGPPGHDVIAATLERDAGEIVAQAFRFPAGRPLRRYSGEELGLSGSLRTLGDGTIAVTLGSLRVAYGVRIHAPATLASDDALTLEPGVERRLTLVATGPEPPVSAATVTALNMRGSVRLAT